MLGPNVELVSELLEDLGVGHLGDGVERVLLDLVEVPHRGRPGQRTRPRRVVAFPALATPDPAHEFVDLESNNFKSIKEIYISWK